MNQGIDYRADFYSLGVTLYLKICLHQRKEEGAVPEFALGAKDVSDRFLIPAKLYGREREIKALLAACNRAASGQPEMMLIAGFSGIGKTAVINEVHKPITQQQGYFSKGKFNQFNRDIPFSGFVQAFRDLMNQILSESNSAIARWEKDILQALGASASVIVNVIPEQKRYPKLLKDLKPRRSSVAAPTETVMMTVMHATSKSYSGEKDSWLSFPAVIRAAQTISQEIELDSVQSPPQAGNTLFEILLPAPASETTA